MKKNWSQSEHQMSGENLISKSNLKLNYFFIVHSIQISYKSNAQKLSTATLRLSNN